MYKLLLLFFFSTVTSYLLAQGPLPFTQEELVYGRKSGMALTLNVLTPKNPNGKAIVNLVSGGWVSSYNASQREYLKNALPFVEQGYTVFSVMHGSIPRFSIADQLGDILRSIQFVRYHAKKFQIDPENIGIHGTSSGGHLSLLAATSNDIINTNSRDSISRVSSKVQAVVAFCPPTDFLNWGSKNITPRNFMKSFLQKNGTWGAFNYTKYDTITKVYIPIEDLKEQIRLDSLMSPTHIVSKDDPPVYLIHGNSDKTVPIQQSNVFAESYKKEGLEIVFIIKDGEDHDLKGFSKDDYAKMFNWLSKKLKLKE